MFEILDQYRTIASDIITISDNYHVFHFDEFPILYAGTNYLGNKVIGSLAAEDEEGYKFRHFHFLVTIKQYSDFVQRRISYKELIISCSNTYVVDKDINQKFSDVFLIPTEKIPVDYLPLENIYCPNVERVVGFDYTVSLQGNKADLHEAFSSTVAAIGKSTDRILNRIGDALKIKALHPEVLQLPSIEGSFKMKFRVKVENTGFLYKEQLLKRYFQLCLDYSVNTLPNEAKQLATGDVEGTDFERKIISSAKEVYESFSYKIDESHIQKLKNNIVSIISDIDNIGSQIGKGFNGVEFSGTSNNNEEVSMGYIDKEYAQEITSSTEFINALPRKGEINTEVYQEYRILVFDLNTDTRTGTALTNNINENDVMDKPQIKIEGNEDLTGSIFTESLHFNKWIVVKAKARMLAGKVKTLNVFFEGE